MIVRGQGSAFSYALPDAFFARRADHATWPEWSPDTERFRVDGGVRTGARGQLKSRGGPKVRREITTLDPPWEDTDTSRLPGARLVVRHTAAQAGDSTRLDAGVGISLPLARRWGAMTGRGVRTAAQKDLDRPVALVEAAE